MRRLAIIVVMLIIARIAAGAETAKTEQVGDYGAPEHLEIVGSATFTPAEIKNELFANPEIAVASFPTAPLAAYCDVVRDKLLAAYMDEGFPEAKIEITIDRQAGRLLARVEEGPRFRFGQVRISGGDEQIVAALQKWFFGSYQDSTAVALDPDQPDGEEPARWLDRSGSRVWRSPADWKSGQPISFHVEQQRTLRSMVERACAEQGLYFPEFDVQLARDAEAGTADLVIEIQDAGPRAVVGEIEVLGNRRNSRERLLDFLQLKPGTPLTRQERTRIERLLWRSARFRSYNVEVVPGPAEQKKPKLKIDVVEYEKAPLVAEPWSAEEQAALKLRDWIANSGRRGDDLQVTMTYDARTYEFITDQQRGALARVRSARTTAADDRCDVIVSQELVGFYLPRDKRRFTWQPGRAHFKMLVGFDLAKQPDPAQPFVWQVFLGVNDGAFSGASKQPLWYALRYPPVAVLAILHEHNARATLADGILSVTSERGRIRSRADTGQLLEFVFEDLTDKNRDKDADKKAGKKHGASGDRTEVRFAPRLYERAEQETITHAARYADDGADGLPLSGALKFICGASWLWRSEDQPAPEPAAVAAVRKLLDRGVLRPLDEVVGRSLMHDSSTLWIPINEAKQEQYKAGGFAVIAIYNAHLLRLADRVFPRESWPWWSWRTSLLAWLGEGKQLTLTAGRLTNSGTTGPLGNLALAKVLEMFSADSEAPARIGLARLTAEDFRHDCQPLFDPHTALGQSLQRTLAALVELEPAEVKAFGEVVFGESSAEFVKFVERLRERRDEPVLVVAAGLLENWWEQQWRQATSVALTSVLRDALKVHGRKAIANNAAAQAIQELNAALELDPADAQAYAIRGWAWFQANDDEKALSDYLQAIQLDPQLALAYACRAELWVRKRNAEQALADFSQAITLGADSEDTYIGRGRIYMDRKLWDKAAADFSEAIRLAPNQAMTFALRGWVRYQQGDTTRALADFDEAVRLNPQLDYAQSVRGDLLVWQCRFEEASAAYTVAIDHGYKPAELLLRRGTARRRAEKYDEALADFSAAIKLNPAAEAAWIEKASLLSNCPVAKLCNPPEAIECAKRACFLTIWQDARALQTLAAACAEAAEFEDAVKYQQQAVEVLGKGQPHLAPPPASRFAGQPAVDALDQEQRKAAEARVEFYRDHKNAYGLPMTVRYTKSTKDEKKPPQTFPAGRIQSEKDGSQADSKRTETKPNGQK